MADQFTKVGLIATVEGIQQYLRDVEKVEKGQDRIQKEMDETAARSEKAATKVVRDWDKVGRSMVIVGGVITGALSKSDAWKYLKGSANWSPSLMSLWVGESSSPSTGTVPTNIVSTMGVMEHTDT